MPAEGQAVFTYTAREVSLAEGEKVSLRVPHIEFKDLQFGDLGSDIMVSPRIAPAMVGMGLLEAVPEEAILRIAQEQEKLGMAGKPNYVWDVENEQMVLGRFGWKANQPSIRQQTAAAFLGDIGATTFLFPEENCPAAQVACLDVPSASKCGGQGGCTGNTYRAEVVPSRLTNITLYLQALAVPARRNVTDPAFARGEALFAQAQCSVCHVPELKTGPKPALKGAANVTIRAYTDLLLHDMGPRACRRPPRLQGERARVAHRAAVGRRLAHDRQRPRRSAARWACAQRYGGDPLARRTGGESARSLPRDAQGGSRCAGAVRRVAVTGAKALKPIGAAVR